MLGLMYLVKIPELFRVRGKMNNCSRKLRARLGDCVRVFKRALASKKYLGTFLIFCFLLQTFTYPDPSTLFYQPNQRPSPPHSRSATTLSSELPQPKIRLNRTHDNNKANQTTKKHSDEMSIPSCYIDG